MTSITKWFKAPQILSIAELEKSSSRTWIQRLVIFNIAKYHCSFVIESSRSLRWTKIIPFIPSRSRYDFNIKCQQLSNCDGIDMRAASYCDVTLIYYSDTVSMDAFIVTIALPARAFQHSGSSSWSSRIDLSLCIASLRGRIEDDHSYGLRWSDLCCHSRHSTNSPVKIWEDPPQIATKTKWLPSCRIFCVDFKNEKFTKINRVEPFQISHYILGPWEKLLKKSIFFSQLWKIYLCLQLIWFISISIPNTRLCGWLDG